MQAVERFAVAMAFVAAAICDQEAHNLLGIATWRANRLSDSDEIIEIESRPRAARAALKPDARSKRAGASNPGPSSVQRLTLYLELCEEATRALARREPVEQLRDIVERARALQRR